MSKLFDAKKLIADLPEGERGLLILLCLEEGLLDYTDLSKQYVAFLEGKNRKKDQVITKAANWLTAYWANDKLSKSEFVRAATAYWLIKHAGMDRAPIGKDMEAFLKSHPYEEDEHGGPKTKLTHKSFKGKKP